MIQYVGLGVDLVEAAIMAAPAAIKVVEGVYDYVTKKDDIENILLDTKKEEQSQNKES